MTVILKLVVYSLLTTYAFLAIGFVIFGFKSLLCWTIGFSFLMLALLTFLYLHGLNTENNWLMLPFLVSEIIIRLLIGIALVISWICYLLSEFDQINITSPIDLMELDQFLLVVSISLTIFFTLMIRFYFPLYNEYRDIKKLNDRRRMERAADEMEEDYVRLHFSSRPTNL